MIITAEEVGTMQITASATVDGQEITRDIIIHVLLVPEFPEPQVTLRMRYKDQDTIKTDVKATWISTNESVVTIDPETGVFKTVDVGDATIVAISEDSEVVFICNVEVRYAWWQWLIRVFLFGFLWY